MEKQGKIEEPITIKSPTPPHTQVTGLFPILKSPDCFVPEATR